MWMRSLSRYEWSSPGVFASAILGVGLVVLGAGIGIGGGDVPDGWVETEAEIIDPPGGRRARIRGFAGIAGDLTLRGLRFPTADGRLVETRCEQCWGGVGDEVPVAYDPARPTNVRQLDFHRVAALALVVAGLAFLGIGVWWSSRRSARARREVLERPYPPPW